MTREVLFGAGVHVGGILVAVVVVAWLGVTPFNVLAVTFPLGFLTAAVAWFAAEFRPAADLPAVPRAEALQGFFVEIFLKGFGAGFAVLVLAWSAASLVSPWASMSASWAKIAVALIGADLAYYLLHRLLMHGSSKHWIPKRARREHAQHHGIAHLDFLRGSRGSWLDNGVVSFPMPLALIAGLIGLDLGGTLFVYMVLMMVQVTHHANFDFEIGPLRWILLSDHAHKLHHCPRGRLVNYGCFFSVWDRIGGTYVEDPALSPSLMHLNKMELPRELLPTPRLRTRLVRPHVGWRRLALLRPDLRAGTERARHPRTRWATAAGGRGGHRRLRPTLVRRSARVSPAAGHSRRLAGDRPR